MIAEKMPTVSGILETALHVGDPKRSAEFYRGLFQFGTLLESERLIALDVAGRDVLLLFQRGVTGSPLETPGGTIPGHAGGGVSHFAFSIAAADLSDWRQRLQSEGVTVESEVTWPGGAQSIYFRNRTGTSSS